LFVSSTFDVFVAERVRVIKPTSGWACTLIFSPVDSEYVFLVGEAEVKLVHVPTGQVLKNFPSQDIDTRCETDAVAVNADGTQLFVATNFSKRLLCFATQGAKLKWDVSLENDSLDDEELTQQSVQSLLLTDLGDGVLTLFVAGKFQCRPGIQTDGSQATRPLSQDSTLKTGRSPSTPVFSGTRVSLDFP
jgi:hypothetical protein